jgi:hypothetical protein
MSPDPVEPGLTAQEHAIVAIQLGREPRDVSGIAARCPFGCPAVIETRPWLSTGAPNPTLLFLTCLVLVTAVSRLEAAGGVRALKAAFAGDEVVREVLLEVTRTYQARRASLDAKTRSDRAAAPRDLGASGIGGPTDPGRASCLHAYAAALLAVRESWLPAVSAVDVVWERLGLPTTHMWCKDDRCSGRARQSPPAEVT